MLFGKSLKLYNSNNNNDNYNIILNDEEEDDTMCLVCCELFSSSLPKEKWVQCVKCKNWSHEACTNQENRYICQYCDSDDDMD